MRPNRIPERSAALLTVNHPQIRSLRIMGLLLLRRATAVPHQQGANRVVVPERFSEIPDLRGLPYEATLEFGNAPVVIHKERITSELNESDTGDAIPFQLVQLSVLQGVEDT